MKQGSARWYRVARGGAAVYAAAVPGLVLLMSMETTPLLLQNTAWVLSIIGLFVFAGLYTRLHFLQNDGSAKATTSKTQQNYRAEMRSVFTLIAWFNLGVFFVCGLIWIYAATTQCLIQRWVLGRIVAEGCS